MGTQDASGFVSEPVTENQHIGPQLPHGYMRRMAQQPGGLRPAERMTQPPHSVRDLTKVETVLVALLAAVLSAIYVKVESQADKNEAGRASVMKDNRFEQKHDCRHPRDGEAAGGFQRAHIGEG
jgi:hypothetical protein